MVKAELQGHREGKEGAKGYDAIYYRYWDYPSEHNVYPHFALGRGPMLIRFEDPTVTEGDKVYWELTMSIKIHLRSITWQMIQNIKIS